jgi:hypothetical protein
MFWISDFKNNWKQVLAEDKYFVLKLFVLLMIGNCVPISLSFLLPIIQERQGVSFTDPILELIPPQDVSKYIFRILYTVLFSTAAFLLAYPRELMVGFKIYLWISLLRICSVYLVPLDPPAGLIYLEDPLLAASVYQGKIITKDLFFSGHTATIVGCSFAMHNKRLRIIMFLLSIILSYLLLVQHIHYTIDIVGAWVFCFLVYKFLTADKK